MERRQKTSGGNGRPTYAEGVAGKADDGAAGPLPAGDRLCMLVCCMLTGYIVLHLEQKEQYRQDTFEVYLQEHGQQDSTAQTEPEVTVPQKGVTTPPDEAALPDDEVTEPEETTPPERAEHVYASPSGKRYHYDAACPGKNGQEITWDEVERRGLTPCKKCAS